MLLVATAWASPAEYAEAFRRGGPCPAQGLCGRILRGRDFTRLTDDPRRRLVFVLGQDGLEALAGKPTLAMLELIGYTPEYVKRKVGEGSQFKLVVFRQEGRAELATWENAVRLVGEAYPQAAGRLCAQLPELLRSSVPSHYAEVDRLGPSEPRFITLQRYLEGPDDAVSARAFLYFTAHLRELFRGNGRTDPGGLQEYLMLDRPLSELGDYELIDLPEVTTMDIHSLRGASPCR